MRIGAFNAAYYAACAVATGLDWWLPNIFGRLRCIQAACIISVCGIILQTASQNFAMFVTGRVVGGLACGIMFALCPVYASEISPPFIRGRVAALYSLNISFSYMVTEWFGLVRVEHLLTQNSTDLVVILGSFTSSAGTHPGDCSSGFNSFRVLSCLYVRFGW